MLRTRSDKIALAVLTVGMLAIVAGVAAMVLEAKAGGWLALVGFVLTFGTLAYAIYFRP